MWTSALKLDGVYLCNPVNTLNDAKLFILNQFITCHNKIFVYKIAVDLKNINASKRESFQKQMSLIYLDIHIM